MTGVREAASFEGLIVLAIIYFILNLLQKVGKKAEQARRGSAPPPPVPEEETPTQQESLSLESILREIERVKQQRQRPAELELPRRVPPPRIPSPPARPVPLPPSRRPPPPRRREVVQDERGPMGRRGGTGLGSAEEVEERTSLEGGWLEQAESVESFDDLHRPRPVIDRAEEAAAIEQRRIRAAEERDRAHSEVDHMAFHARIRTGDAAPGAARRYTSSRLREAIIWREILGPPKGLQ